jgi:threonine aldolase
VIDLRSDTVTRPTAAIRKAMYDAEVGDDVYGEDPTVVALEEKTAALLGHEAGLFTATGSLANILGVRLLVPPGRELLCEARAHIVRAELGAHAALSGVTSRTWSHPRGLVDLATIEPLLEPDAGPFLVSTAAVAVENTHNFGGGSVQPLEAMRALAGLLAGSGVALHLDGARLWNAHVATGVPLETYGRLFDTVSVCLSKGLGAPVGSVLVSSAERIAEARTWRKRLGGGMRQAGVLAAAGIYALDNHLSRLADDHGAAKEIATIIADVAPNVVDPADVETNIVVLHAAAAGMTAQAFTAAMREHGILVGVVGRRYVRLVTHLDVGLADCRQAAQTAAQILATRR